MSLLYTALSITFFATCVLMILLILIQKGRGGGLSSAFGGGGGGNTAFGAKTGDMLTWVTSVFFVLFLLLSMSLTWTGDYLHARGEAIGPVDMPDTYDTERAAPREVGAGTGRDPEELDPDRRIPPGDTRVLITPEPLTPDPQGVAPPQRDLPDN